MCKPHYFLLLKLHDKERNHSFNYKSVQTQRPVSLRNDEALWHYSGDFSVLAGGGKKRELREARGLFSECLRAQQ